MAWRLALDMGTNSLGWAAFKLDQSGQVQDLMDAGVRIFPDGREPAAEGRVGESLAVERRLARGVRRNRDRRINRKRQLMERLVQLGLMPSDERERKALEALDPYKLRADGVEKPLTPHELGRVLFHINQRRGFLSNRKTDSNDEETGTIKPKITELRAALKGRTLGQWLNERLLKTRSEAKKTTDKDGSKNKPIEPIRFHGQDGDYYADRAMYIEEFDAIREAQEKHHSLSKNDWQDLRNGNKQQGFDGIFFQRKLKPVERGRCEFFIDEYRAHKDLPISHEFRILQETTNLQYYGDNHEKFALNGDQRGKILEILNVQKTLSFGAIKKLKYDDGKPMFPRECLFNLEVGPRDKLNGNATAVEMRKPELFGADWDVLSPDDQNDVLELLHDAEDESALIQTLTEHYSLSEIQAKAVSTFKLSSATTHLSRKFMVRCAQIMRNTGKRYDEAVADVWDDDGVLFHHSHRTEGPLLSKLPYYGEVLKGSVIGGKPNAFDASTSPEQHYGKINNPTVHVALNQLRRLVNSLVERFGPPDETHVELVRDLKKSSRAREEISRENRKFAKANEGRAALFRELNNGQEPSGLDLKKIRLWEELGDNQLTRLCPFSGRVISAAMLFNGEAEVEHILPFSRTLDSSSANLTVATRQANRLKGNNTPHEAFANGQHADQGFEWSNIANGAKSLPKNKRWRFDADAMERFDKEGGFIARQLADNAYISRVTKRYLGHICDQNKIATIPGGLTAMMRGKWQLNGLLGDHNFKERNDHRHHVIDAFVVGLTDRWMLQQISKQTGRGADDRVHIKLPDITQLRDQLSLRLDTLIVSYKKDHGTNGKMFNATAYGLVAEDTQDSDLPGHTLVTRKKIENLSAKEIGAIRNPGWRTRVQEHVETARASGTKIDRAGLAKVLAEFGSKNNIKTIRILVKNQSAEPIPSAPWKAYAPDSFVCVDIWQVPKGKPGNWKTGEYEWRGAFWSYAQCKGNIPDKNKGAIGGKPIHPAAKFITRLFKNDMIELIENGQTQFKKVAGFSTTNNKIDLRPQYETMGDNTYLSINVLRTLFKRKVHVSEDGHLRG